MDGRFATSRCARAISVSAASIRPLPRIPISTRCAFSLSGLVDWRGFSTSMVTDTPGARPSPGAVDDGVHDPRGPAPVPGPGRCGETLDVGLDLGAGDLDRRPSLRCRGRGTAPILHPDRGIRSDLGDAHNVLLSRIGLAATSSRSSAVDGPSPGLEDVQLAERGPRAERDGPTGTEHGRRPCTTGWLSTGELCSSSARTRGSPVSVNGRRGGLTFAEASRP